MIISNSIYKEIINMILKYKNKIVFVPYELLGEYCASLGLVLEYRYKKLLIYGIEQTIELDIL